MPAAQLRKVLKAVVPPILVDAARAVGRTRTTVPDERPFDLRDREFYTPRFSPWKGFGEFKAVINAVSPYSLVSSDRVWVLYTLAQQACHLPGNFWECGVYKGGTAIMLERVMSSSSSGKKLHLFDTFAGMPEVNNTHDNYHTIGDFADTSLEIVRGRVGDGDHIVYHAGFIPDTFVGFDSERIALAHIDVDIYRSVIDCSRFIYPRVSAGGFMVFDDYGFDTCVGARIAVDEFFADKPERPLVLPTGQAVVIKLPG